MFGKFVVESTELWAEAYRIDGLRFDLMGHHPKDNILEVRAALDAIDPDIMMYGEGWDFGEVAEDALFEQATQQNMAGTDIGTFNDRMRDAVRGGGPFDEDPRVQGFGSGLLRSKSLDRDSYDSGDWFNAVRWNCEGAEGFGSSTNGFGIGLPPSWTSEEQVTLRRTDPDAGRAADVRGDRSGERAVRGAAADRVLDLGVQSRRRRGGGRAGLLPALGRGRDARGHHDDDRHDRHR